MVDAASFNENGNNGESIQLSFDLYPDLEEIDPSNLYLVTPVRKHSVPEYLSASAHLPVKA